MQRPQAVTVFGVLNIVFGAMALLCSPISLLGLFLPVQAHNPMSRILHDNATYRSFTVLAAVVGMVAGAVLIAAGIGLLKLKPWARLTSIGYGIFAIVFGIVGLFVNWFFVFAPLLQEVKDNAGSQAIGAIAGMAGGMIGGCLGQVYPILLLIFMTRPKIRAAFEQPTGVPQG